MDFFHLMDVLYGGFDESIVLGATTDETNCECQCTSDLFSGPDCGETPPNVALRKPSFAGPVVIEGEPKLVNDGHLASCVKVGGGTNTYWQVIAL